MYTSSKDYEEISHKHNMDLLIILHILRVSYPVRSGCKENGVHLRPTCLVLFCASEAKKAHINHNYLVESNILDPRSLGALGFESKDTSRPRLFSPKI